MNQRSQVKPGARPERREAAPPMPQSSSTTGRGDGSRMVLSLPTRTPPAAGATEPDALPATWQAAERAWLAAHASPHTRRHYRTSWGAFCQFMGEDSDPCRIASDDVNAWIASLRAHGRAASTIVSRVAACASLYDFVAGHVPELLTNRYGRLRSNPFRNEAVRRPRVAAAPNPQPLPDATVQTMLARINTDCVSGARDHALLLTALTTGWQTAELVSLRWAGMGDDGDGEIVELWRRGPAHAAAPLPPAACRAVRHYLSVAGRWPLAPGEPVWLPLRSDGVANFPGARPDARRPISGCQANNILRRRLRLAGVAQPEQYHLRDLRRTFARKYLAVGGDASGLRHRLEHARASVTQRYIAHLAAPVTEDAVLAGWV
jgi:site-specific recombinase XerD